MREGLSELIGAPTSTGLCDKSEVRRIVFAQDLESLAHRKAVNHPRELLVWVEQCIHAIKAELLASAILNNRIGGLLALTSLVLGTREALLPNLLNSILSQSLKLFDDEEPQVRYFACESVFNILKVSRVRTLPVFAGLLDGVCKLAGDVDGENKQTSPILDRLLKEVVSEHFLKPLADYPIASTIETHVVFPNPYVKQVCLGWIVFLRSIPLSGIVHRLPCILPSLLSLLSSDQTVMLGRKDLAATADSILSDILADAEFGDSIPQSVLTQTLSVLVKYGNFQDTLSLRARTVLFDWIRVVAVTSDSKDFCADIVRILLRSFAIALDAHPLTPQPVDAIKAANKALLASPEFTNRLVERANDLTATLEEMLGNVLSSPKLTEAVMDWIAVVSDKVDLRNISLFFALDINKRVLSICLKHFGIEQIALQVLILARAGKPVSNTIELLGDLVAPTQLRTLISVFRDETEVDGEAFIFTLVTVILSSPNFEDFRTSVLAVDDLFVSSLCVKWRHRSPMAAVALCMYTHRWSEAMTIVDSVSVPDAEQMNAVISLLESEVFRSHRLALVSTSPASTDMTRFLLKLTMLMQQDSSGFKLSFNRLQLVNLFKLL